MKQGTIGNKAVPHSVSLETDMTEGNILHHILIFSIPLFIGNLFQQFYNLVDTAVVGKFVSDKALAAVSACGSTNFLFFSLSSGLSVGIGVIAAHYFGAKDEKGIRQTIVNAFYVLGIASLVVTVVGLICARPLLILMETTDEVLDDAVLYLRTTCLGILFIALYNGVSSILRAVGDSRTPLIFLIISTLLNIGFDLLFVLVFHLGVFGVALATVVAQFLSAAVSLIYAILRVPYFKLSELELTPHWGIIGKSFKLGIPIAIQSSMIAISLMVLQGVVNSYDDTNIMGAFGITGKVDVIFSQFFSTLTASFTTFAGQNFGANKLGRVRKGYLCGVQLVFIYNIVIVPLVILLSRPISSLFVSSDAVKVIDICSEMLKITTPFYFALSMIYIPRGILNGVGDASFSLINGISEVVCRILFSALLTRIPALGYKGIWWATGFTWFTVAIVCNIRYFSGHWNHMKKNID